MMEKDDMEVQQAANDIIGTLDQSGLNFYESIATLDLAKKALLDQVEYGVRRT